MKRILLLLLVWLPGMVLGQQHVTFISKDSLKFTNELSENWRWQEADDMAMASASYDDSAWPIKDTRLQNGGGLLGRPVDFKGIGWFRLHFLADTSIVNIPLAFSINHYGASQVYLDGVKIGGYGIIKGKDSSEYYVPQGVPFVAQLSRAGMHVLAVRYANYDAALNYSRFKVTEVGFRLSVTKANSAILSGVDNLTANLFVFVLLFGIFITLAFVHLCLYLYHRASLSNLFFSVFCCSLGLQMFLIYLGKVTNSPITFFIATYASLVASAATCYSLSGFINDLFSKRKTRFRIITVFCLVALISWYINSAIGAIALSAMFCTVTLEAIILTIRAIYRKVRGAKILGTGILFFAMFFLFSLLKVLVTDRLDVNQDTLSGKIFLLILILAVLSIPVSISMYLAWTFSTVNKDLKAQLEQVRILSEESIAHEQEKKLLLETQNEKLEEEVKVRTAEIVQQHDELKTEKKKSDDLLLNILPAEVAEELKEKGSSEARYFNDVTVLFTDFVGFTKAGERMSPQELVDELHSCFMAFDQVMTRYDIEKIKTIGDAYLAVAGLPQPDGDHAAKVVAAAMEIVQLMKERRERLGDKTFEVRVGVHSGSVVAGIVGVKKFAYDIWGDTVNTAARMEQNSLPGKINISQNTYELVKDRYSCSYRGEIAAKNKGELSMYFVDAVRS